MNSATVTPQTDEPDSDLGLLVRLSQGDRRAGDLLQRRIQPQLRPFFASKVSAADVEDLEQQVWGALAETLRRTGARAIHTSVRAYVLGIARHVLFRWLRRQYQSHQHDPIESSIAELDPSISQAVGEKLAAEQLILALQQLPIDTQVLLEFRYVHEMTVPEIAALYDIPEGTIKSRLARARELLEQHLTQARRLHGGPFGR